jgi:hypothetical protein
MQNQFAVVVARSFRLPQLLWLCIGVRLKVWAAITLNQFRHGSGGRRFGYRALEDKIRSGSKPNSKQKTGVSGTVPP